LKILDKIEGLNGIDGLHVDDSLVQTNIIYADVDTRVLDMEQVHVPGRVRVRVRVLDVDQVHVPGRINQFFITLDINPNPNPHHGLGLYGGETCILNLES